MSDTVFDLVIGNPLAYTPKEVMDTIALQQARERITQLERELANWREWGHAANEVISAGVGLLGDRAGEWTGVRGILESIPDGATGAIPGEAKPTCSEETIDGLRAELADIASTLDRFSVPDEAQDTAANHARLAIYALEYAADLRAEHSAYVDEVERRMNVVEARIDGAQARADVLVKENAELRAELAQRNEDAKRAARERDELAARAAHDAEVLRRASKRMEENAGQYLFGSEARSYFESAASLLDDWASETEAKP